MSSAVQPIFNFFRHPIKSSVDAAEHSPVLASLEQMLGMAPKPAPQAPVDTRYMMNWKPEANAQQLEEVRREQMPRKAGK